MEHALSAIFWRYTLFLLLLLSCLPSTKSSYPPPPPPSPSPYHSHPFPSPSPPPLLLHNISAATKILRSAGYKLFARTLQIAIQNSTSTSASASATMFVPSDAAFARMGRKTPLSTNVLRHHLTKRKLSWKRLESLQTGAALATWLSNRCLFLCRTAAGGLCVAVKNGSTAHRAALRHPDLYADSLISIHGVDSIINPAAGSPCPRRKARTKPTPVPSAIPAGSPEAPLVAVLLNDAVKFLKNNGYGVVSMAMHRKFSELVHLERITIFAPPDEILFAGDFRFDFGYHVVPHRLPMIELLRLPLGARLDTLRSKKGIVVTGIGEEFSLNNVPIKEPGIFHDEILMVHSVKHPLEPKNSSKVAVAETSFHGGPPLKGSKFRHGGKVKEDGYGQKKRMGRKKSSLGSRGRHLSKIFNGF